MSDRGLAVDLPATFPQDWICCGLAGFFIDLGILRSAPDKAASDLFAEILQVGYRSELHYAL